MQIELTRDRFTDKSTMGTMTIWLPKGKFTCYTLEPTLPKRIEPGTYEISLYDSPRFKRVMPLLNHPNRFGIEIHWGNYPKDTIGCILVGETHARDFVGFSRDCFNTLFAVIRDALDNGERVTINIVEKG